MAFADGLTEWVQGKDSDDAAAAAILVAETLDMHNKWLRSKFKKQPGTGWIED